jgi:hypothetical protein
MMFLCVSVQPNGRASEYQSVHERLFKEGEQRKKETQLAVSLHLALPQPRSHPAVH